MTADRWQLMPDLSADEYAALKADIAANGVRIPIVIDAETGAVIDGHHRLRAVEELAAEGVKVPTVDRHVIRLGDDEARVAYVLAANLFRRHLSRRQRGELVAQLRAQGWSLRRIGGVLGTSEATVRREIASGDAIDLPERVKRKGGGTYPATRPKPTPGLFVRGIRDEARARAALVELDPDASTPSNLLRAEEKARDARMSQLRKTKVPERIDGPAYELRLGDLREVWVDLADQSVDAIVTDPPYNEAGVPLYRDLAELAVRVLKPGRLAAIYCGHVHLDEELALLEAGGLTYVWHGVNILGGLHSQIRSRMMNGNHRSVLLYSAGKFTPRKWVHDTFFAEGKGGPESRPLHPWQQAVEPVRHWVWMTSEPAEVVFDPFIGSGTTAIAAVSEGRRFLGGDLDPACVETTRQRLEELAAGNGEGESA